MPSIATHRPTALVTGASSGIGEALAGLFAAAGHDLVLVARSADKLKALATALSARHGVNVRVEPADLSKPGAAETLATRLKRARVPVDVLVNNAGVLAQGRFAAMDAASHQQMIDLNISGLTAMLSAFVPPMVARGTGRVLNVASIASFQPVPSPGHLRRQQGLRAVAHRIAVGRAARQRRHRITALCPGITATGMLDQALDANPQVSRIPGFLIGDVTDVARQGFDACMKGEVICVPGVVNQAAMLASRSTPKWLLRRISGLLGRQVQ
jgi:short-subunit dehydrogenase